MGLLGSIIDFLFGFEDEEDDEIKEVNKDKAKDKVYKTKQLMSDCEKYFYDVIRENLNNKYILIPQVNLASIVNKQKDFPTQYQNELYRNIDFGIFDKETMNVKLLVEINDKTHNQSKRVGRDIKVKDICEKANIKLITFYTKFPNKKEYIINRINENLK